MSKGIDDIVWPRLAVYFDAPSSHGIDLTTAQGLHAGDPWSAVVGQTDVGIEGCNAISVEVVRYDVRHESRDVHVTAGVGARLSDDGQTVDWLVSPEQYDSGGCA